MTTLGGRSQFIIVLAMVLAIFVACMAVAQKPVIFGQETNSDSGSLTDINPGDHGSAGVTPVVPSPVPSAPAPSAPVVSPPQAPVDTGVNALPSAGSGGYLDQSGSNALFYALIAGLGLAVVASGSLVWAHKEHK